jgi:hypothetical protein
MANPRSRCVDEAVTPWYHCISRCVRRLPLCGGKFLHRKQWIEDRLQELVEIFSVECAGFAVMDNHLHLLLRLDSRKAEEWSDEEVVRRWCRLFPLRNLAGEAIKVSMDRIRRFAGDPDWVNKSRKRLADLGWFMKCLKEPLARRANPTFAPASKFRLFSRVCLIFQSLCDCDWYQLQILIGCMISWGTLSRR